MEISPQVEVWTEGMQGFCRGAETSLAVDPTKQRRTRLVRLVGPHDSQLSVAARE